MSITVHVRCTLYPQLCCSVHLPAAKDEPYQPLPSLRVRDLQQAVHRALALRLTAEQKQEQALSFSSSSSFPFSLFFDLCFLLDQSRLLGSLGVRDGVTVDLVPARLVSLLLPEACFAPLAEQRLGTHTPVDNGEIVKDNECDALVSSDAERESLFPLGALPLDPRLANLVNAPLLHDIITPSVHSSAGLVNGGNSALSSFSSSSPSSSSPVVSLSLTWPKVVALSVVPNLVLMGGWFLAMQHFKEHKTFDQISQESGDAAAQGFLQALAKDDYKVCREIVKKIITGWVDEVNPWRSVTSVPPLLLQLPPSTR